MQPTIEIRQATDADIPAIAHIINEAWKTAYAGIVPQGYLSAMREERKADRLREGLARVPHIEPTANDAHAEQCYYYDRRQ